MKQLDVQTLPAEIKQLVELRNTSKQEKHFTEADAARDQLLQKNYKIVDTAQGFEVYDIAPTWEKPKKTFIVILGSDGSISASQQIHDYVFKAMDVAQIHIGIITTPAGFQPNVKVVYEEKEEFFQHHLQNYHPQITTIYANSIDEANDPAIVAQLDAVNYIYTGPGSPTYALEHLKGTLLYEKIIEKVKNGASLALSSAATIAFSKYALPVYEIYKVGEPLHWEDGLNFYSQFYEEMTIIPHFNNNEGGEKTDTSYCFMGKERYEKLMKKLPNDTKIWGIDENTAMIIDIETKQVTTLGKDKIHVVQ